MLANWIKETTVTTGTGTITLGGAASADVLTFASAYPVGSVIQCVVKDGNNRESGLYTLGSGTLDRTKLFEKVESGTRTRNPSTGLNLSGSAVIFVAPSELMPTARHAASGNILVDAYASSQSSNATLVADRLYAMPFCQHATYTLDQLALRQVITAGAAGTVGRLGLYACAHDGGPGILLGQGSSTIAMDSTGFSKVSSLSADLTILPGMYFIAVLTNSAAVVAGINGNYYVNPMMGCSSGSVQVDLSYISNITPGWSTLPSNLTGLCTPDAGYNRNPRLYARWK